MTIAARASPETEAQEFHCATNRPIGKKDAFVRALNFSGNGFDTVMQLGVAHALLVIQGRAPDVITGVSAGAIQATALAEILQAGEDVEQKLRRGREWNALSEAEQIEIQEERLHARVARLREFAAAVQRTPEEFLDAALPNGHQIDERKHLEPLLRPLYSERERTSRIFSLSGRAGLLRLYNEILDLPLSIGSITRLIRRVLGLIATSEIPGFAARSIARIVEGSRLWILFGLKLPQFTRVLRTVLNTFWTLARTSVRRRAARVMKWLRPKHRWFPIGPERGTMASTIITRFKRLDQAIKFGIDLVIFFVLLVAWVSTSLFVLGLPYIAVTTMIGSTQTWMYVLGYATPLSLLIFPSVRIALWRDPGRIRQAVVSIGAIAFLTVAWGIVLAALVKSISVMSRVIVWFISWLLQSFDALLGRASMPPLDGMLDINIRVQSELWFAIWIVGIAMTFMAVLALSVPRWRNFMGRHFGEMFLKAHDLNASLLQFHPMKMIFTELFDPNYYGQPDMPRVIERSLAYQETPSSRGNDTTIVEGRKCISWYDDPDERLEPIALGIAVADVGSKKVRDVPAEEPIVSALLAATAITPLFEARTLSSCEGLFVDAANVTRQPSRILLNMLRHRKHPESKTLHMYNVAPLPFDMPEMAAAPDSDPAGEEQGTAGNGKSKPYLSLVDVVRRAMSLRRFRDAQLERRLTEQYTKAMPVNDADIRIPVNGSYRRFFRAWVTPIELDSPVSLNTRILEADKQQRRERISETIADGCRASLQVMVPDSAGETAVACEEVVRRHLEKRVRHTECADGRPNTELGKLKLPGRDDRPGPGLSEVCEHCHYGQNNGEKCPPYKKQLNMREYKTVGPAWPHERESKPDFEKGDPHFVREQQAGLVEQAPCERKEKPDTQRDTRIEIFSHSQGMAALKVMRTVTSPKRPTRARPWPSSPQRPVVSLLFSGGVFRGVYQMGVVNALNMLGLRPDLIAGASVGTITAAMVATVFATKNAKERHREIARLASVYLALDQLILTDRFADFVRDLTIRAAQTEFSIRDADHLFRKYDHENSIRFTKRSRRVVAGIERLFYVSPFQLVDLTSAVRRRNWAVSWGLTREYAQQWLERMHVGQQVLGAEPLQLLIDHYVLEVLGNATQGEHVPVPIGVFLENNRIAFLATTTSLRAGRLEVLGEDELCNLDSSWKKPTLREALLASSAFPGVFRPRWSTELRPASRKEDQYIDGGVMDNLPIQPTVDFLVSAAKSDRIPYRPQPVVDGRKIDAPHLILAASLQRDPVTLRPEDAKPLADDWIRLMKRTRELKYNAKVDIYSKAEKDLQIIWDHFNSDGKPKKDGRLNVMNMEVVTIKPNWLCSTFGFHPMLGFRRSKQAASIAHGCATTLLRLGELAREKGVDVMEAWNVNTNVLPQDHVALPDSHAEWKSIRRDDGYCWLNPGVHCPFSKQALQGELEARTTKEIAKIYEACQTRKAHFPEAIPEHRFKAGDHVKLNEDLLDGELPAGSDGTVKKAFGRVSYNVKFDVRPRPVRVTDPLLKAA